jgi:hypothetical protein
MLLADSLMICFFKRGLFLDPIPKPFDGLEAHAAARFWDKALKLSFRTLASPVPWETVKHLLT